MASNDDKVNDEQWNCLLDFIAKDFEMRTNTFTGPNGTKRLAKKWVDAAVDINNLGGASKNGPGWRTAFSGLKRRAKKAYVERKAYMNGTGGGESADVAGLQLNAVHERCLTILGTITADGHESVADPFDLQLQQQPQRNMAIRQAGGHQVATPPAREAQGPKARNSQHPAPLSSHFCPEQNVQHPADPPATQVSHGQMRHNFQPGSSTQSLEGGQMGLQNTCFLSTSPSDSQPRNYWSGASDVQGTHFGRQQAAAASPPEGPQMQDAGHATRAAAPPVAHGHHGVGTLAVGGLQMVQQNVSTPSTSLGSQHMTYWGSMFGVSGGQQAAGATKIAPVPIGQNADENCNLLLNPLCNNQNRGVFGVSAGGGGERPTPESNRSTLPQGPFSQVNFNQPRSTQHVGPGQGYSDKRVPNLIRPPAFGKRLGAPTEAMHGLTAMKVFGSITPYGKRSGTNYQHRTPPHKQLESLATKSPARKKLAYQAASPVSKDVSPMAGGIQIVTDSMSSVFLQKKRDTSSSQSTDKETLLNVADKLSSSIEKLVECFTNVNGTLKTLSLKVEENTKAIGNLQSKNFDTSRKYIEDNLQKNAEAIQILNTTMNDLVGKTAENTLALIKLTCL